MNYITNYYKNLSEQLQAQVNHLEREVRMINEAMGAATMSSGAQSIAQAGRPEATTPGYDPQMLAALLAAWGQNSPQYDLNGDGVVDGADLGMVLGGQGGGMGGGMMRSTQLSTGSQASPAGSLSQGRSISRADTRRPTQVGGGVFDNTGTIGGQNGLANPNRPTPNSGSPYDLNGDGVVDGIDLGLALGGQGGGNYVGVLQNWGIPTTQGVSPRTMTQPPQRRRRIR